MKPLKRLILIFSLLVACLRAGAQTPQSVVFEADAPQMVAVGKVFKVEYNLNAKPDQDSFVPPSFTNFDVLAGPSTAVGSSISVSGSNVVKSESYVITYVVTAKAEGMFELPAAKIKVDGKEYSTRPLPIEVVSEGQAQQGNSGAGAGGADASSQSAQRASNLADDDILIRAIVDKTNVYKGQPVRVAFKLYTRVQIAGRENIKMPAFNGFWAKELDTRHYTPQRETYNSKIYDAIVLYEYLLYPQQAGTLQIEQLDLTLVAQVVVQSQRGGTIFDEFFGGGPDIQQISRKVSTTPVSIKVNDWPAGAPAGFNGAVGAFTMTSEFPTAGITANSPANYQLRIAGTGNLPLIQSPKLEVPASFEQYNTKTTENLTTAGSGIKGEKVFEYPLIARAEGHYVIDPIKFSYFNPETASYVTLSTDEYELTVGPDSTGGRTSAGGGGLVSGLSKEDVKILGQDIRFIKIGNPGFAREGRMLMGSPVYFLLLLLIVGLFVFALIYLQKRIKEMRNTELVRGKRANKVALQRLKAAEIYMRAGSQRNFYEEMLKALWGYMGDKLNIPAATLTKENVRDELLKKGIPQEQIARYMDLISECEYAQYSPAGSGQMHEIYRNGVGAISKFESLIKR